LGSLKLISDYHSFLQVGDYKNHLTKDQLLNFKEWTEKWLKDSDFPYYRDYWFN